MKNRYRSWEAGERDKDLFMAGRPDKLTEERARKIVNLIASGSYVETAAAACGVSKNTLYDWLKRGARAPHGKFKKFADDVAEAAAKAEARDVLVIDRAASGHDVVRTTRKIEKGIVVEETTTTTREFDWRAAAWRLERKFPKRWGLIERIEHSGPDGGPIPVDVLDEKLGRLIEARARRIALDGGTQTDAVMVKGAGDES